MAKMLSAEEAAQNDELSLTAAAIDMTAKQFAEALAERNHANLVKRQTLWRNLYTKYELDKGKSYTVTSGPDGAELVEVDPRQFAQQD